MTEQRLEKLWNKAYYYYLDEEEAQELIDYYKNMEQENKHLNLQLDQALKEYEELQIKVEKAIEWVNNIQQDKDHKHLEPYIATDTLDELLEILGGTNE